MRYRKGQQQVLAYNGGRMGVAAVPGAGKTTTLAALAAQLIQRGLPVGSRVLVVTYQNAGADNVQARIRGLLEDAGRPAVGFEVRTLHSLSYTILRENPGLVGLANPVEVLDSRTTTRLLDRAVSIWNNQNPDRWRPTLPDASKRAEELWTRVCRIVAQQTIRVAKGTRLTPEDLLRHLSASPAYDPSRLHVIGAEVYALYQQQVRTLGGLDYDDLVRLSVDLLTEHPDVAERLRKRWPFVLEDEAQDSVPLQEELLTTLTGEAGNWVRVGDPNQAIMSTFTAADPRYLTDFLAREDVAVRELDEAGRSAPVIMELANRLVDWVCTSHPVSSVREGAFRHQLIQPTGPGDPQPNPPAGQSKIEFFGFPTRKDQHVLIAERAVKFCRHYRTHTHAILVPTNDIGFQVAAMVRRNGGDLDEMLSTTAGSRQVAETLRAVLAFVVDPVDRRFIVEVVRHLFSLRIPELAEVKTQDAERAFRRLHTEQVLYPVPGMEPTFEDERLRHAVKYIADWLRRWLRAAQLPVDQLVLTVADDLFAESRLATAHRVANTLRTWADQNPSWRLSD
ncbi:MAG: ATP-dependent helicase, partial [Bacteroidota bacterium]